METRDLTVERDLSAPSIHDSVFTTHEFPRRLFLFQLCVAALIAPWYSVYGLYFDWRTAWALPPAYLGLGAAWFYCRRYSSHPRKFIFRDVILAMTLLLFLTNIVSPAQYLAVAIRRPLIDEWLTRADAWMGIDVEALSHWTRAHGVISLILSTCYYSLMPQFLLPLVVLGLRHRDRSGVWEYVFHFHFCLLVTVAALALFPAVCAYTYLDFTPTIDQARVVRHITALRAGTFHRIDFTDLEGLITMPSFHAAGGMMVTWAFRRHRGCFLALALLNAGLLAATFVSGVHYFVDILGSAVLFAVSVAVYRFATGFNRAHAMDRVTADSWVTVGRT